jgi:hypothetical protein
MNRCVKLRNFVCLFDRFEIFVVRKIGECGEEDEIENGGKGKVKNDLRLKLRMSERVTASDRGQR